MSIRLLIILFLSVSITGCAGWRSTKSVDIPDYPDSFLNPADSGKLNSDEWWREFKDAQLDTVMRKVFANNLKIQQAVDRLVQFKSNYNANLALLIPFFSLNSTIQESGDVGNDAPPLPMGSPKKYDLSLSTRYEIDIWGKVASLYTASKYELNASKEDLNSIFLIIGSQAARSYFSIIELKQQLELLKQTELTHSAYLDIVKGKYSRGVTSSMDVYRSEMTLK
ncbi:TolC family protein, partial [bacterium]|nr:TolC family protein [bacterium]